MAISPRDRQEDGFQRVLGNTAARVHLTSKAFFTKPLHYLFLLGMTALLVGLAFGVRFRPEFYALNLILGVIEFARFVYRDKLAASGGSE